MRAEMLDIEKALAAEGFGVIAGVDEAGRGPFAGDVYAAAVILPDGALIEGLDDSKKLTEQKRDALFDEIQRIAISYSIATATVAEIEEHNILGATLLAMNRAISAVAPASTEGFIAMIDGNQSRGIAFPNRTYTKGDSRSASIAAASILAKVARDRYMVEMDARYPGYGFAKHKGYGTAAHTAAILQLGVTEIHRKKFLRKLLGGNG